MRHHLFAGLAAVLIAAGLVVSAPTASAGCLYGGLSASRCDGPVQPDGTWQRCVIWNSFGTDSGYRSPDRRCDQMGPDLHPWGLAFNDPPTHIDD
jgi:hypothetical protein